MSPRPSAQPATRPSGTTRGDKGPTADLTVRDRRIGRSRVMVTSASPYPVQPVPKRPRWWVRLRGLVGMSVLVVMMGLLLALAVGILLALLAVWMLTALT